MYNKQEHKRITRGRRFGVRSDVGGLTAAILLVIATAAAAQDATPRDQPTEKDKQLGERLIRNVSTDSVEDPMEDMIRLMDRAAHNLEITFDAGDSTQAAQQRIMERLDEAIRAAAAQRRPTRSRRQRTGGDKRRMPKDGGKNSGTSTSDREGMQDQAASTSGKDGPSTVDSQSLAGDLHERRRSWGHLPERERDEIIQGISDRFLERYRLWIEQYYRALQETEE